MAWLRRLPPFLPLKDAERESILPFCSLREFGEGETLIREGDPNNSNVYFILSGGVSVYVKDKFILTLRRPGDIFGEMSLVSDEHRSATVKTDAPTRCLMISSALSMDEEESPQAWRLRYLFTRMFSNIMAEKLRITSDRAKMYEDAILQTKRVKAHSTDLEGQVALNLRQIRLYSFLVDSARDAILMIGLDGTIERVNPAFETLFSIPPGEVTGRGYRDLIIPSRGVTWDDISEQVDKGGWSGEAVFAGKTIIPVDCSIFLIHDAERKKIAYSVFLTDIRQRKTYENHILQQREALTKANEELKKMDRLKDQFMTLVSHELRTPITSILAAMEMMTMGLVDDEAQKAEFLGMVWQDAQRLARLVDKVMAISKLESNQMHLDFETGQLDEQLKYQAGLFRDKVADKPVVIRVSTPPATRPTRFDQKWIREVFHQVMENAVNFTEKGEILLELTQPPGISRIIIRDTGEGIHEEHMDNLFNKFEKMASTRYQEQGIGLGLPLSFLIVKAHQGKIAIRSKIGRGTEVSITLPDQPSEDS